MYWEIYFIFHSTKESEPTWKSTILQNTFMVWNLWSGIIWEAALANGKVWRAVHQSSLRGRVWVPAFICEISPCFSKKINKTATWWEHTRSLLTRYAFLVNIYDFLTWHVEHIFRIYATIRTWSARVGCGSCPNWNFKCHDNFRWWVRHWPHIFILPDYCQNCNLGHRQPK